MSPNRRCKHHAREDDLMQRALAKRDVRIDNGADERVERDEDECGDRGRERMREEAVQHDSGAEEHGVVVDCMGKGGDVSLWLEDRSATEKGYKDREGD
jgi:hypothetical protein